MGGAAVTLPDVKWAGPGDVHVWSADAPAAAARFEPLLSREEIARAGRFAFAEDRSRFVAARGLLRWVAGRYFQLDPRTLCIAQDAGSKPTFEDWREGEPPQFSVSHSGDLVLVGMARTVAIGVDVEKLKPEADIASLAQRVLHPSEWGRLTQCPPEVQVDEFFRRWTIKEACAKASGLGMALDFAELNLDWNLGPEHAVGEVAIEARQMKWSVCHWTPKVNYRAAIAACAATMTVKHLTWSPGERGLDHAGNSG